MAVNFATPIGHQTGADYTAFANSLVVGRPFRQPLLTALNPEDYVQGIELFLSSSGAIADIFAWLDSSVTWVASSAAAPGNRLVLRVEPDVLKTPGRVTSLNSVQTFECKPLSTVYENVEVTSVQAALESILNAAYLAAGGDPATWHPSMLQQISGDKKLVKVYLDGQSNRAAAVTDLVTAFVNATPDALLKEIIVKAGQRLGRAAPYLAGDVLPSNPPFVLGAAGDVNRARRLTFVTESTGREVLNPVHYLHVLMRRMLLPAATRVVNTLTNTVLAGNLAHPLVTLYPALGMAVLPKARSQVNSAYRFALGGLADWHRSPRLTDPPASIAKWRYAANGQFEARDSGTDVAIPLPVTDDHRAKVGAYWNNAARADVTNRICSELQLPVELVVALACTESLTPLNARSIRVEPLLDSNRETLRASAASSHELEYDKLVGLEATITGATYDAGTTTQLNVMFAAARKLTKNRLAKSPRNRLLIGDADRLEVTANSSSTTAIKNYQIKVKDTRFEGGSRDADTQAPGLTLYYSIRSRAVASTLPNPIESAVSRAGRLRRLVVGLGSNTLSGVTTVTVMRNGVATAIVATIAAGKSAGNDLTHSEDVNVSDRIALRVQTAAGGGQIRGIKCNLQLAPDDSGTVYTLEGFSPSAGVPNPWNDGLFVSSAGSTLTWAQLIDVVNGLGGQRVSPGLLQTLISTAIDMARYLNQLDPGIYTRLGLLAPPATSDPLPATSAGQFLNDWLLTAEHSVLLGAAFLRKRCVTNDTRLDLPYVGAAYNGGNTKAVSGTRWGFQSDVWDYPDDLAPYFNAAVELFNGPPAPATAPAVRFMS